MAYSEYWNPKTETMPREQLQQLQLYKLRSMCEWAYARVPFHKQNFDRAGFHPEQLKSLDDIRRIPFMTREGWVDPLPGKPLFGDMLSTEPANPIRYHLASGT